MKENEKEIFIDEMANLGDEWTIEELKGTSYEKNVIREGYKRKKISSWENGWHNRHHYFLININRVKIAIFTILT